MGKEDDAIFPSLENSAISSKECESIVETIKPAEKSKRIANNEEGRKLQNRPTSMV